MNNSIKKTMIAAICGAIFLAFLSFLIFVRHVIIDDYKKDVETNDKKFAEVLSVNINFILERYFDLGGIPADDPTILNAPFEVQRRILRIYFNDRSFGKNKSLYRHEIYKHRQKYL